MRVPRKLILVAFGVAAALVALEIVLQVVAYVIWSTRAAPAAPVSDGARVVLCVGDSFTYGLRATETNNAYPAVAQRALAEGSGAPIRFVNLGWPGQDSAQVLARLPAQLARHRPELVYVLVGYNDFWRSGEEPTAADVGDGFPIVWRTGRLLSMLAAAVAGGPPDEPADGARDRGAPRESAPFLGPWHTGSTFFEFRPDGTIDTSDGPMDGVWSWRDDALLVELRNGDPPLEIDWRIEGDVLRLEGGMFPQAIVLERGLPDDTAFERARNALRAGDRATAERELEAALEEPDRALDARLLLARLHAENSRDDAARDVLGPAVAAWTPAARTRVTVGLVDACVAAGALDEGFAIVARVLREGTVDEQFIEMLIRHALRTPDRDALDRAILAALARPELTDDVRIALWGLRVQLGVDAQARVDSLIEIALRRPDDRTFARTVRWSDDPDLRARFVARAERLPQAERERVTAAFDAARGTQDSTGPVLARNLRAIVATCRSAGAEPVLMTYPGGRQDVADVVRAVSGDLGTGLVDHLAHFEVLLRSIPREDLFASDGHCNDAGYVEMGRLVAEDVRTRLR